MVEHRIHRHMLYSLVIILAIIQITSLIVLSITISRLNASLDSKIQKTSNEQKDYTENIVESYDKVYQQNFQTISQLLSQQQKDFSQEIKLLKSAQEDFSGIVRDSVQGVVTISTPDSVATGFIVAPSGYVVTNFHAVSGHEDNIMIITYDRSEHKATFVGKSSSKDLVLLKIDGEEYKSLKLANIDEIQVGQKVIAIGNPLGLSFTVTEGIISGLHRPGPSGALEYIQTDVPLNPGNSGGPLINTKGEAVGINNFKIGGAESLGFALESDVIRSEINSILNKTLV